MYEYLTQIKDPTLRSVLKILMDHVNNLNGQAANIGTVSKPLTATMDAGTQNITNVKSPLTGTDATNKDYVDTQMQILSRRIRTLGA